MNKIKKHSFELVQTIFIKDDKSYSWYYDRIYKLSNEQILLQDHENFKFIHIKMVKLLKY